MAYYAEVILPLPLFTTFTYRVEEDMRGSVTIGSRVIVQFGKKKFYTGIVAGLTDDPPGDFEVKPIMSVLDSEPILRYPQLKFWQWVADYYLSAIGDVYRCAIPTGLKPESETWVALNPDFETDDGKGPRLTDRQELVLRHLKEGKRMRLSELETATGLRGIGTVVTKLLALGIIEISENVTSRYRPKTVKMVGLCCESTDTATINGYFEQTSRSPKQEKTLLTYLSIERKKAREEAKKGVTRQELMEEAEVGANIIKALVDKGILHEYKETVNRFDVKFKDKANPAPLSEEQQAALDGIKSTFRDKGVCLLHGVTGSGKTEIYTHLITASLQDGNQVLYLVPEISLTTQLTDRLRKVFGDRLLVYHSRFSDNERADIYKRLLGSHEPTVILGARSSVFLPFARLGLIIVDEEHESSYKQFDPAPRYNARDAAIVLAGMHGAKTLLGSATPSVETYRKALDGKYGLVTLQGRYGGAPLPQVEIVDMRSQRKQKLNKGILSEPLRAATRRALESGRQAIMFINRRGFAPVVVCKACGWTPRCPNCDVALVYHKHDNMLRCHYCGYAMVLPALCPACGENAIEVFGYGTERIAEEVAEAFPQAKVSRMDTDTTRNKDSYQEIIEEFSQRETDILVGTQMVTKGLDFAKVDVVGVLNADTLLNFPDFRSDERAFNMMEQVAGRAGRRDHRGRVLIQTTDPGNRVLDFVRAHDYDGYYREQIADREKYSYPPFTRIINVYIKNKDRALCDEAAVKYAMALRNIFGGRVLGPEKPFVSRVATYYLQSIMLKIETAASMKKVKYILRNIYESLARDRAIKTSVVYYDVDPV